MKKVFYNTKVMPYIFLLPAFIIFTLFFLLPLLNSFIMSFQSVNFGTREFVGLDNYKALINPTFLTAVKNSIIYMLLTLVILIPIPFALAIMLENKLLKGVEFFKSVLFLPALTSTVVIAIVFKFMFSELEYSQMNLIIESFGYQPIKWLSTPAFVMPILVILASWKWIGINMLYFISGIKSIPAEVNEAALLDGVSGWQRVKYITIPMVKPITVYVLTISIYAGLAMFTETMLIYGLNSPNNMALTIVGYLYKVGIQSNDLGLASAIGTFLLLLALLINIFQLVFTGFFKET